MYRHLMEPDEYSDLLLEELRPALLDELRIDLTELCAVVEADRPAVEASTLLVAVHLGALQIEHHCGHLSGYYLEPVALRFIENAAAFARSALRTAVTYEAILGLRQRFPSDSDEVQASPEELEYLSAMWGIGDRLRRPDEVS